ncbi:adenylate/guanylate cyclase domain-containing protein [Archangium lipolyticum]|uniref:adenylate/guanylate cyclase domain-containing protein n=1 Tax=Archangium lipolyticum TaxID=2970465 RepID=UPI00214A3428|nr:adenylate/guanylate cyclase domain-containing protein [Archangium lipolyticum]
MKTLAAFVPASLVRGLLQDPSRPREGARTDGPAVVLFADLSGFTQLAESLERKGPEGAERLAGCLDSCFAVLVSAILDHGGDVLRFAGDAVLAAWEAASDEELPRMAHQAVRAAMEMQAGLERLEFPGGGRLRLRVGMGAGEVRFFDIGGVGERWEFLAAGLPLLEMARAEGLARPGEILLSASAWRLLESRARGEPLPGGEWRLRSVEPLPPSHPGPAEPPPHLEPRLRAYVPEVVRRRLEAGHTQWLAEFRNVTVLFVNLTDPEVAAGMRQAELQRAFRAIQEALAQYGGSLNQVVVDDKGVVNVAAFGLPPLAHEDDAARATLAGQCIQASLRALGVAHRIGITSGRVFCGVYGNARRREYVTLGDVVNQAARLMQAAGEGQVLCDAATARLASSRVRFEPLPPVRVKGKTQPLEVYRPEERVVARDLPGASPDAPMVNRDVERGHLAEAMRALVEEGRGGVVFIEGEPGIGKSRLLAHLLRGAERAGLTPCFGAGEALEPSSTYLAWRAPLSRLLGLEGLPDVATRTARLMEHLRRFPEVQAWAPLLNAVLPVAVPDNEVLQSMSGATRAESTRELVVRLLLEAAGSRPLLLVLDDVHWMDSSSWALAVAARRQVERLLLVLSGRPMGESAPPEYRLLREQPEAVFLPLERMTQEHVLDLVCQRLEVRYLPREVAELIRERAEGHPLFSEEFAYAVRDSGLLRIQGGECRMAERGVPRALGLPGTVQGIITSRLDLLSPPQQLAIKVASILGRSFTFQELSEVYPVEEDRALLPVHLEALVRMELVVEAPREAGPAYAFKHALIQEAAYALMTFAQRRLLHQSAALALERRWAVDGGSLFPRLAHHWRMAEEPRRALEYLERAGEEAFGKGAWREAITFYTQARELTEGVGAGLVAPDDVRRARWCARLGEAFYFGLGDLERSRSYFTEALLLLDRPLPSSRGGWLVRAVRESLRQLTHVAALHRLRPRTEDDRERLALAARITSLVGRERSMSLDTLGWFTAALAAINDAEAARQPVPASQAYSGLGSLAGMARLHPLARRYFLRARHTPDSSHVAYGDYLEGSYLLGFGRWEEAFGRAEHCLDIARWMNDRVSAELGYTVMALGTDLSGEPAAAQRLREAQLEAARAARNLQLQVWTLTDLASTLLCLGRLTEAQARLSEVELMLSGNVLPLLLVHFSGIRALAALRAGDLTRARAESRQALGLMSKKLASSLIMLPSYSGLAETCLALWEEARRTAAPETREWSARAAEACRALRSLARMFPVVGTRALRLEGVWLSLAGRPSRAASRLRRALAVARRYGMPYDEGLAHYELARALLDPALRTRHLVEARALFTRLGCAHHLRATETLALQLGLGGALTASEAASREDLTRTGSGG